MLYCIKYCKIINNILYYMYYHFYKQDQQFSILIIKNVHCWLIFDTALTVISMFHAARAAISRDVQEYYAGGWELFKTWGKKCVQLTVRRLVQEVLVRVFSSIVPLTILLHQNKDVFLIIYDYLLFKRSLCTLNNPVSDILS